MAQYKHIFDDSATHPANLIVNEEHDINLAHPHVIVPRQGLAYTKTITVRHKATNADIPYKPVSMDGFITGKTGYSAVAGIELSDPALVASIYITYQAVGGAEGIGSQLAIDLAEVIKQAIADPTFDFFKISNRPAFYPGADHPTAPEEITDLYLLSQKFEKVFQALNAMQPRTDSFHDLHQQLERMLKILAEQQNEINGITALTGSANQIQDILERLDTLSTSVDAEVAVGLNAETQVISWDEGSFRTADIVLQFNSVGGSHREDIYINNIGSIPSFSSYIKLDGGVSLFTYTVTKSGGRVRVMMTPTTTGKAVVKVKTIL